jgi:hypothetical protein
MCPEELATIVDNIARRFVPDEIAGVTLSVRRVQYQNSISGFPIRFVRPLDYIITRNTTTAQFRLAHLSPEWPSQLGQPR